MTTVCCLWTVRHGLSVPGDFVPARLYVVGAQGAEFPSLRITSDHRLDGVPFTGFRSMLINELALYYT